MSEGESVNELKPIKTFFFPLEINNGNDGRGSKWFSSSKLRKRFEQNIFVLGGGRRTPFEGRVSLRITRILGKRQQLWDADSVGRGSVKELIDAMVACGWFVDDGPKYIRPVDYRQDETRREDGPAVQIEVFKVNE